VAIVIVLAAVIGFAVTRSSKSPSNPSSTTSTSSGACASGGSCGYENVTPADAVEIIANQTTGPGSLKNCTPTSGEVAALKGTGSSEWDCITVASGASATYTINADGSVDY
jgi:FlaG/FlaF family flagellin (archaellin)